MVDELRNDKKCMYSFPSPSYLALIGPKRNLFQGADTNKFAMVHSFLPHSPPRNIGGFFRTGDDVRTGQESRGNRTNTIFRNS